MHRSIICPSEPWTLSWPQRLSAGAGAQHDGSIPSQHQSYHFPCFLSFYKSNFSSIAGNLPTTSTSPSLHYCSTFSIPKKKKFYPLSILYQHCQQCLSILKQTYILLSQTQNNPKLQNLHTDTIFFTSNLVLSFGTDRSASPP